jgi:hypothetical protein
LTRVLFCTSSHQASLRPRQTRYVTIYANISLRDRCSKFFSKAPMNAIEQSKKRAAYIAVDHHVKPEHRVSSVLKTDLCILVFIICFRSLESVLVRNNNTCEHSLSTETRDKGSTVPYVVERIIQQGSEANKNRVFIPSGTQLSSSTGVIDVLNDFYRVSVEAIDCRRRSASW